eukprot:CAMPEP_0113936246 /NCGR_PEP_ID=MMETSP1339-20121228/3192_1 /TAXON_ID=94617 /ORGANISM="Fibrocapsa japonica" /LENGTH=462 /DNA_ID=CAMNT_0000938653 /DNA_START=79 /DNA_END=1467 /DNA_ORIENTATION=- /assembly_acc=CAM_ASM_000762
MGRGGDLRCEENLASAKKFYTWDEVAKHRTPADAWMVYQNKVYDVSNWQDHPGGAVIFTHAGDDFTDIFAAFHPKSSYAVLDKFLIGYLDESTTKKTEDQKNFEKAYRTLRTKLVAMGMYNASIGYYIYKCLSNLAILMASVACVVYSGSWAVNMFGAFLLALFWQQCGWLAHDFLHHQVFENRAYGDMMGIVVGNVAQGFSVAWWKNKHNAHHAVPNLHESSPDSHDGDPDIDTMPLLAWSLKMAERVRNDPWGRFFIRHQAFLYFPILLVARLSWLNQSFFYAFENIASLNPWKTKEVALSKSRLDYPVLEKAGLVVHYLYVIAMCAQMPFLRALTFFVVSQTMSGLLLALVFGLGHNGMSVYDAAERPDFWKLQVTTTRNVTSNWFTDWFCGGLQYQVDHHLFPMIPRHNLKKVHGLVESFCKEQNVKYHEANMLQGTVEVLTFLGSVSKEFLAEFPAM